MCVENLNEGRNNSKSRETLCLYTYPDRERARRMLGDSAVPGFKGHENEGEQG